MPGKMEVGQEVFDTNRALTHGIRKLWVMLVADPYVYVSVKRDTPTHEWSAFAITDSNTFATEAEAKKRVLELIEREKVQLEMQLKRLGRLQGEMEPSE